MSPVFLEKSLATAAKKKKLSASASHGKLEFKEK
jgi:hypothetical protein